MRTIQRSADPANLYPQPPGPKGTPSIKFSSPGKYAVGLERSPNSQRSMTGLPTRNLQGADGLKSTIYQDPVKYGTVGELQLTCLEPRFCKGNNQSIFPGTVLITFIKNKFILGIPWRSSGQGSALSLPRAQVQSLVEQAARHSQKTTLSLLLFIVWTLVNHTHKVKSDRHKNWITQPPNIKYRSGGGGRVWH